LIPSTSIRPTVSSAMSLSRYGAFIGILNRRSLSSSSGDKGLELASMYSVDVVIVDYLMPEMNGHEVAIEIKRLKPQAPIIMLSAAVDIPEQALKLVDAFIAKDSLASQLLPTIAQFARMPIDSSAFV